MAKINITSPTGVESLSLISAFKAENNTYVVFDSEKTGSMGLPIIYISKLTTKLEKITDPNEWQSVKNYLKGIINGTNFEYIKVDENLTSDEAYFTPLTLPIASFDTIKNRYVVVENTNVAPPVAETPEVPAAPVTPETPAAAPVNEDIPQVIPTVEPVAVTAVPTPDAIPSVDIAAPVNPAENAPIVPPEINVAPVTPIIPNTPAVSNETVASNPAVPPVNVTPEVPETLTPPTAPVQPVEQAPVMPATNPLPPSEPIVNETPNIESNSHINFESDKATFLKACENMFDALAAKYQKELADLEAREEAIKQKENEIESKMQTANEHLANAAAREQVANIAHDNAQKIMDVSNLMPTPNAPTAPQTGVI